MTAFMIDSNNRYLLAFLNSKITEFLLNIWAIKRRGGYKEYKTQYISKLPIKDVSENQERKFASVVDKILSAKEEKPNAVTNDLEKEIDQMFYELYGLTEEEIGIVENNV
jgi:hypothetical protein